MKALSLLALVALVVVSCHIDKLLTGGKTPPSDAPPARVAFSSSLGSARARAGDPITPPVQVNVQDSAGRVTLRDTLITLSLAANPGGAKLRGDTVAHSVDGVATFANIRLDKAASGYTLTAAAPNLHPDTSAAFSVMPAPATDLQFTVQPRQPSAAMQDSAIKPPVQVTAYDSLGNKVINFTGLVGVTLGNDGSVTKKATLSGGDPVPAVAGVATFPNLRIDQAGVGYTLTAAFGTAQPVDTSTAFNITPGPPPPATHLAFTQQPPQTTQAGAAIVPPVQIAALDAAEHVVQGFTGAIGLALEPASNGGTLSGGDPVNAVNGIATFANLSINKAGTGYTLRATAPPLTDATSSAFAVTAPPSGSLRVTTSTSGDNLDTDGYTVTVDGTTSQSIGNNSSGGVTFSGLSVASHTVELTGVANNCTVTAPNPRTVAVTDGATAVTAFVVTCSALTGGITVTTGTTGSDLPTNYTVTVDGGQSRTIQADGGSITYTGLSATTHTVALTDVPGNCTVTGGPSKTIPVTAGQTATAAFTITCTALTGSLTVTTATTGSSLPSTYTVTLDGGSSRTISADGGTTTYDGLSTTTHTVALTDVPGNCTVTGGASKTVPVTAGQTATAAFTITCSALTGSLTVTTATTGSSQPSTYTVTVDGGQSRTISANGGTTTYSGLSATTHTVALTDVPANCTVSGGASHSVTVTASQTTTEPFSISCAATTGSLAVTTTTTGPEQPSGYTVSVSGGGSQSIGTNQTITFTDLAPGSHSVALNGAPSNCSVSGGPSQTVNVTAGQTATASFTISCVATTGSLTVTAATTGSSQPSTYTVTVDGGQSRTISANGGTTTYSGLSATTHTVALTDVPANCTVSGGASHSVTVTATQTTTEPFSISCAATTGSLTVTAATTGSSQPSSYTVTVDDGQSRTISANGGTTTYSGLSATTHTVALTDVPANCTVGGGASHTVAVTAGQTTTEAFSISCVATTGSLTVSTTTTGGTPDPDGYTVSVSGGGGGSQHIDPNASLTFFNLAVGSHTVTLSGIAPNCSVSGGTQRNVNVPAGGSTSASFPVDCPTPNQPPTADFSSSCTLLVCTFTSTSSDPDGTIVSYSWTFGDGGTSNEQNPTHVYTATGSYTVRLTVQDNQGATASASHPVSVSAPANQAPSVNAGPDDTAVTGLLYSFSWSFSDANHNGPWSYTIDWGDGQTSSGPESTEGTFSAGHTYIIVLPRSFTITVTVTDASGASGSDSKVVSVFLL